MGIGLWAISGWWAVSQTLTHAKPTVRYWVGKNLDGDTGKKWVDVAFITEELLLSDLAGTTAFAARYSEIPSVLLQMS